MIWGLQPPACHVVSPSCMYFHQDVICHWWSQGGFTRAESVQVSSSWASRTNPWKSALLQKVGMKLLLFRIENSLQDGQTSFRTNKTLRKSVLVSLKNGPLIINIPQSRIGPSASDKVQLKSNDKSRFLSTPPCSLIKTWMLQSHILTARMNYCASAQGVIKTLHRTMKRI
jgi:hypothetical protein